MKRKLTIIGSVASVGCICLLGIKAQTYTNNNIIKLSTENEVKAAYRNGFMRGVESGIYAEAESGGKGSYSNILARAIALHNMNSRANPKTWMEIK